MREITDEHLIGAVSKVNAIIRNPEGVKAVRAKYTKGAIVSIERERRAEFIADILHLLHGTLPKV